VAAMTGSTAARQLALDGAAVQMVSHGLLTGGMFLMVGMLQHRTGTREIDRFGGLIGRAPAFAGLFGLLAFGSLGLPGLSGFIAEFQVIGATLQLSVWVAAITVLGLILATAVYLRLMGVLMGGATPEADKIAPLTIYEILPAGAVAVLSLLIGIFPAALIAIFVGASRLG